LYLRLNSSDENWKLNPKVYNSKHFKIYVFLTRRNWRKDVSNKKLRLFTPLCAHVISNWSFDKPTNLIIDFPFQAIGVCGRNQYLYDSSKFFKCCLTTKRKKDRNRKRTEYTEMKNYIWNKLWKFRHTRLEKTVKYRKKGKHITEMLR